MTTDRQVLVFNTDAAASLTLRSAVNGLPDAKVLCEVSDHASLCDALRRLSVSVVLFHLDPDPEQFIGTLEAVAAQFPKIPIIGVSERTDPQTIVSAMRAGCVQFVFKPIDRADLGRAIDRVAIKPASLAPGGRRICVVGASGGVGTTTIACNLALEIAHLTGKPSAVVDMHLEFGDVASTFDCHAEHTIANLCQVDGEVDRTALEAALVVLPCNVAVLARPANVADAGVVTADRVTSILRLLSNFYSSVVVDTPRSFDRLAAAALEEADNVLIVVQLIVPSVRNSLRLYHTLMDYGMPEDRVQIVVNRYRKNVGRITPEDVEKQFKKPLFGLVPNDYERVTSSLDFGHTLMADAPNSPVRTAIHEIASKLITDPGGSDPVRAKGSVRKGKLLGRLFGG